MTTNLAQIVANANVSRLSLIGLSKNVGKTTTVNHLVETLLQQDLYDARELAITSLGLDGEATDAVTGLPKPRYVPQAGLLVATTEAFISQAESEGAQFELLLRLPGRTALGPVVLARVLRPGRIIIAGPTLLRELRTALDQIQSYGTRLSIIDGAINRLGAAAINITDACIVCTGTSVGATPQLVARKTANILARLTIPLSIRADEYKKLLPETRLLMFLSDQKGECMVPPVGQSEPVKQAKWIVEGMQTLHHPIFLLRGALTEELSRALLARLARLTQQTPTSHYDAEMVVSDGTKIFCHSLTLQRLAARGLHIKVATSIRILALTINPFTPEYTCTSQQLLDALVRELPKERPPILDVVSGIKV